MSKFTIKISGYCKYVACGSISKELHFFWKANRPDAVKAQLFPGAFLPPEDVTPIIDQNNPLFLDAWKQYNNVIYLSGLYPDMMHVFVFDHDDNIVWAADEFNSPSDVCNFNTSVDMSSGFYIKSWRTRKGDYGTATVVSDKFDSSKLTYHYVNIDGEVLVHKFFYDGRELEITEGLLGDTDLGYKFMKIK